jgi:hypothetical protein
MSGLWNFLMSVLDGSIFVTTSTRAAPPTAFAPDGPLYI